MCTQHKMILVSGLLVMAGAANAGYEIKIDDTKKNHFWRIY